jgi:membrane-bound lytic murein transglycosylase B
MSATRFGRLHKATAIVPMAVLSAAWTANLAGLGPTVAVADDGGTTLPDGTDVPTQAIKAPASVSMPGVVAPGVPAGQADDAVRDASAQGIPSAALAAYQRAESVINAADKSCNISWQLIAAIGRVESDHGRFGGNVLDKDGVATPGIYGIALNGKNDTAVITDTDAGQYDDDARWDRAVGPMQFIPSTWSVVGVDGDSDGKRDPQDIDDAALATAVYLCSGDDDLSTAAGQRRSVFRYNHSNDYVDLVLSIMQAYLDGDFVSVPTSTTSGGVFMPDPTYPTAPVGGKGQDKGQGDGKPDDAGNQPSGGTSTTPDDGGSTGDGGGTTEEPTEPVEPPEDDGGLLPGVPGGGGGGGGGSTPPPPDEVVEDTLTKADALAKCLAQGVVDNPLTAVNELTQCVDDLLNP